MVQAVAEQYYHMGVTPYSYYAHKVHGTWTGRTGILPETRYALIVSILPPPPIFFKY